MTHPAWWDIKPQNPTAYGNNVDKASAIHNYSLHQFLQQSVEDYSLSQSKIFENADKDDAVYMGISNQPGGYIPAASPSLSRDSLRESENHERYNDLTTLEREHLITYVGGNKDLVFQFIRNWSNVDWRVFRKWAAIPGASTVLRPLINRIPALDKKVAYPCNCANARASQEYVAEFGLHHGTKIADIIMHLNDSEQWTYARIADWLDTLGLDFSFPMPDTVTGN
jgi:hypothetical protein